jgi:hypothetical protein
MNGLRTFRNEAMEQLFNTIIAVMLIVVLGCSFSLRAFHLEYEVYAIRLKRLSMTLGAYKTPLCLPEIQMRLGI